MYLSFSTDDLLPLGRATVPYKYSNRIAHLSFKMYFNPLDTTSLHIYIYIWQSQVEIEHCSVAYFNRIPVFEVP